MVSEYSDTPEDTIVRELITHYNAKQEAKPELASEKDLHALYYETEVEPEAHYNYYGTRGVADLYVEDSEVEVRRVGESNIPKRSTQGRLFEIKSEYALEQAGSANEIVRQFNKMVDFFFRDESRSEVGFEDYELAFIPTEKTVQHLEENREIYKSLIDFDSDRQQTNVVFREPGRAKKPVPALTISDDSVRDGIETIRPDLLNKL